MLLRAALKLRQGRVAGTASQLHPTGLSLKRSVELADNFLTAKPGAAGRWEAEAHVDGN